MMEAAGPRGLEEQGLLGTPSTARRKQPATYRTLPYTLPHTYKHHIRHTPTVTHTHATTPLDTIRSRGLRGHRGQRSTAPRSGGAIELRISKALTISGCHREARRHSGVRVSAGETPILVSLGKEKRRLRLHTHRYTYTPITHTPLPYTHTTHTHTHHIQHTHTRHIHSQHTQPSQQPCLLYTSPSPRD